VSTPESKKTPAYRLGEAVRPVIVVYVLIAGAFLAAATSVPSAVRVPLTVLLVAFGLLIGAAFFVTRYAFWGFLTAYVVIVMLGSRLRAIEPHPKGALIAVAVGSVIAAIGFMITTIRGGRRNTELERMLFSESTSLAFFLTMIGAITYSLLEAWVDAPRLSMWVVWSVGMGSWAILSLVLKRRYS
jgi:hypothetical protein